ncbi:MAG: hypothetical protein CMM87_02540 [Rickettsiales bacterium]|nr:hypothetical protein [Rickettsiales bacterium]|tara:strand:- start:22252 stop:23637 length:1386 start_codon:yes stop_codon:yes gene_type:complete
MTLPIPLTVLKSVGFCPKSTGEKDITVYCLNSENQMMHSLMEVHYQGFKVHYQQVADDLLTNMLSQQTFQQHTKNKNSSSALETLDDLLQIGLERQASDIHLVAGEDNVAVRLRCDGCLLPLKTLYTDQAKKLKNAIKVRAQMDVAEKRQPQSGSFRHSLQGTKYEVRVSTHPTLFGESTVLRLLTKSPYQQNLEDLGFAEEVVNRLTAAGRAVAGMIILTGPTGSGKTTTLYSVLKKMDLEKKNIMTLEQPVEYFMPCIRQTEVREGGALTFAAGVRSILRQDPDVILIGEIRDAETAAMAMRAAMTGHLVLTTVHTRDAWGVLTRLEELGVPGRHIRDLVTVIVAQRLMRRLCQNCKSETSVPVGMVKWFEKLGLDKPPKVYTAVGCDQCFHTGYKGRFAIGEMLTREEILAGDKEADVQDFSTAFLRQGLEKVAKGETTFDEVLKHVGIDHNNLMAKA